MSNHLHLTATGPGRWALTVNPAWPGFAGHFPGNPVLPGAELIELARGALNLGDSGWRLELAKFLRPVLPGDALELIAEGKKLRWLRAGEVVAEMGFV